MPSRALIFLLALTTGLSVTTIYLLQPLLHTVGAALGASPEKVGLIVTLTQAGYGLGILFLIPLGDVYVKKNLILFKLALLVIALVLTGFAQNYLMILTGSLFIGIFATTAQDIVPLAADLSPEKVRGVIVGQVMSGLLLGILLSRTVSGFIADAFGWRAVFWISAALIGLVTAAFAFGVRAVPVKERVPYSRLLLSTIKNIKIHPPLRRAIYMQGLLGLAFSAFWTNLAFLLSEPPFSMSSSHIGLFGLAGVAGALAAPVAGKLSDRRGPRTGIVVGGTIVLTSFALMWIFPHSVAMLLLGAVGFDLGVQMALVSHQSIIYALDPGARARINAAFVASLFAAFAVGSLISVQLFARGGWTAVLGLCIGASTLSLILTRQIPDPKIRSS